MSYCRFEKGASDVYLYPNSGIIVCCYCKLTEYKMAEFYSPEDALIHLQKHADAGHLVPEYAIERLLEEKDDTDER